MITFNYTHDPHFAIEIFDSYSAFYRHSLGTFVIVGECLHRIHEQDNYGAYHMDRYDPDDMFMRIGDSCVLILDDIPLDLSSAQSLSYTDTMVRDILAILEVIPWDAHFDTIESRVRKLIEFVEYVKIP